jgi:hypothetical protein
MGLVMLSNGGISWSHIFWLRPEDVQYSHPTRGTVIQTFNGGFVDDFGEGLVDISVNGHTGWRGGAVPGELEFLNLRDWLVLRYHEQRKAAAESGLPIGSTTLYWADTLNLCVYEVYPIQFTAKKNKQRPLLYQYSLRMTGLRRSFGMSSLPGLVTKAFGGLL